MNNTSGWVQFLLHRGPHSTGWWWTQRALWTKKIRSLLSFWMLTRQVSTLRTRITNYFENHCRGYNIASGNELEVTLRSGRHFYINKYKTKTQSFVIKAVPFVAPEPVGQVPFYITNQPFMHVDLPALSAQGEENISSSCLCASTLKILFIQTGGVI